MSDPEKPALALALPDPIAQEIPGLPRGYYVQVYLESGAYSVAKTESFMAGARALNVAGMLWHQTNGEINTPEKYGVFSARAAKHGLKSGAAFGLGLVTSVADAKGIGQRIARIAKLADLTAWDMENDRQNVDIGLGMLDAYDAIARDRVTIDQPWAMPIPRHHGSPLWPRAGKRMDARCPQFYPNQPDLIRIYGRERVWVMWPKYVAAWQWLNAHFPDCVKPVVPTIQGRGWSDCIEAAVDVLMRHQTLVIWCEALPSETMVAAMRVTAALRARGFDGGGGVEAFQRSVGIAPNKRDVTGVLSALGIAR